MEKIQNTQEATPEQSVEKTSGFQPSKEHAQERILNKKTLQVDEMKGIVEQLVEQNRQMQEQMKEVVGFKSETLLKSHGVDDDEVKELITQYQSNTGKSLEDILENPIVKQEIRAIKGRKRAELEGGQGSDGARSIEALVNNMTPEKYKSLDPETKRKVRQARNSTINANQTKSF